MCKQRWNKQLQATRIHLIKNPLVTWTFKNDSRLSAAVGWRKVALLMEFIVLATHYGRSEVDSRQRTHFYASFPSLPICYCCYCCCCCWYCCGIAVSYCIYSLLVLVSRQTAAITCQCFCLNGFRNISIRGKQREASSDCMCPPTPPLTLTATLTGIVQVEIVKRKQTPRGFRGRRDWLNEKLTTDRSERRGWDERWKERLSWAELSWAVTVFVFFVFFFLSHCQKNTERHREREEELKKKENRKKNLKIGKIVLII